MLVRMPLESSLDVEYDNKTNRCVGFVLPIGDDGLLMTDEFLALSFEST